MNTVERALSGALYTDDDAALDTAASLLAADPTADTELHQRCADLIRRTWRGGWQPADVIRLVRRDLTAHHLRLAARLIESETHTYPQLPPQWQKQLAELAPLAAEHGGLDRFTYATSVLEICRLIVRLPAIEPVGPGPDGPGHPPPTAGEPRQLTRIRALLAKAEATDYPEEAEAFTAKAQDLMTRYSLDEALLATRAPRTPTPSARRIGVDAPYEATKAALLDAVAHANHCRTVWHSAFCFSTVVGFEGDLETVELLYTSLTVQAWAAMSAAEAVQRKGGRKRTKTFRQSFLAAYAHRMSERLARVAEEVPAPQSLLPQLASRDLAVAERIDVMFPRTTTTRLRAVTDATGWREGTSAADATRLPSR